MLTQESTESGAKAAINEWARSLESSPEMAGSFYRANMLTEMGGALFVVDIEAAPLFGKKPLDLSRVRLADEGDAVVREESFLRLPFDEAIQHFESRNLVTPEEFDKMSDAERFRSFAMRRAVSERTRDHAHMLLTDAMQPGGIGLREFTNLVRLGELRIGITPSDPSYLETVYRTATSTSYNAGRLRGQMSPNVIAAGGLWEYLSVSDNRVRPAHKALHGKQWEIGDPEGLKFYPPLGFRCRCSTRIADREDASAAQLARDVSQYEDEAITEGFSGPPTEAIELEASAG